MRVAFLLLPQVTGHHLLLSKQLEAVCVGLCIELRFVGLGLRLKHSVVAGSLELRGVRSGCGGCFGAMDSRRRVSL